MKSVKDILADINAAVHQASIDMINDGCGYIRHTVDADGNLTVTHVPLSEIKKPVKS